MSRTARTWARFMASCVALGVLVWRLGASPFLDGVRTVNAGAVAAAAGVVVATTVCSAWRWKIVARGLGVQLSLPTAVAAYYRAMFLNVILPGGIVGDVHRGISHGREVSAIGRALRAVAWERFAGQVVQVALTVIVLLTLPSPVRPYMPLVAIGVMAVAGFVVLMIRVRAGADRSAWARVRGAVATDIGNVLGRRAWVGIALASALVFCGHVVTFLIAARTAGITAPLSRMLPLALLVIAVMVIPSVGGWGPREGAAAWAFGAAGLGADRGVATAVAYGVMVAVACLPGAAVLVVSWFRRRRSPERMEGPLAEGTVHA
jgi:glycosyltransferase 2 family protein